ncbi:hypothetical protein ACFQGT_02000 [Natrialbaceae archaeon GCM10025810]|uniref:hypothetical protein n=1 Tax=Halovalidus salilacus TaxID=3075124 RepID=UPI00361552B3
MDRRQILLGSGVALTTAIAGCAGMGDETSEDDGNGNGDENGKDSDDEKGKNGTADVPGVDTEALVGDHDGVSVDALELDGGELSIELSASELADADDAEFDEKTRRKIEALATTLEGAIEDPEAFAAEVETVEIAFTDDEEVIFALYADVRWILELLEGSMSEEELAEKVEEARD